ncbi:MAG TPA: hypothetical protein QGF95_10085 [Candidatus Latescibacteria bacterium]|jgi:L-seryl-tRNA(Ser) seleniumtransferase|nr:hypothetical protein [Gemmatimonadaceae bacterium]MDP6019039.1 hypothetical protein [Candidatus Latescibacterota bacterium]HJP30890.1 hypothetical protein [Candidatus Latescibacterota bacterium]
MDLSGEWQLELKFLLGEASYQLSLDQADGGVSGRYRSQYGEQDISGSVGADGAVQLRTGVHYQACGAGYTFTGRIDGDRMTGEVDLGEYWKASWSATRQP